MASLGQWQMHAMQWVQFFPQTGVPFVRRMLFRGQITAHLPQDVQEQVNINIKYDGYIKRQMKQVEQFKKMEEKKIPENINYDEIQSLRIEAKQKLNLYRPINIGQASRISGVSPADISVLLVYLGHK